MKRVKKSTTRKPVGEKGIPPIYIFFVRGQPYKKVRITLPRTFPESTKQANAESLEETTFIR